MERKMSATTDTSAGKCPVVHSTGVRRANRDWWPNQLNLQALNQHSPLSDPMGQAFDYAKEFRSLDLDGLQDVWLRRRPRRRLGTGRALLGAGGDVAWRRTLQRRTRAAESARRGADGPDLRESGGT